MKSVLRVIMFSSPFYISYIVVFMCVNALTPALIAYLRHHDNYRYFARLTILTCRNASTCGCTLYINTYMNVFYMNIYLYHIHIIISV